MVFHGWHPNSPLSHPFLTRRAFFSDEYPEDELIEFQRRSSRYESFLWPLGMMYPFVNARRLLRGIRGWGHGSERVFIMAGTGEAVSFAELDRRANRGAHLLRSLGLKPGDAVALMMDNSARYFEVVWAAERVGVRDRYLHRMQAWVATRLQALGARCTCSDGRQAQQE